MSKITDATSMPMYGIGTWQAQGTDVYNAIRYALSIGVRHIDTAWVYQNEADVGSAIRDFLDEFEVKRSEIYVTSKLWNTFHDPLDVRPAFQDSLSKLNIEYIDLYLMHWPMAYEATPERYQSMVPRDEKGEVLFSSQCYLETYGAMEDLLNGDDCHLRSIGVSNFNLDQLSNLLRNCGTKPHAVQVEMHPLNPETEIVNLCNENGVHAQAYAPLGAPNRSSAKPTDPTLLDDPVVTAIAESNGCTAADVLIGWCLARNVVCLAKSVTPSRILSNFNVGSNIKLTSDERGKIDKLHLKMPFKYYRCRDGVKHPDYPFKSLL